VPRDLARRVLAATTAMLAWVLLTATAVVAQAAPETSEPSSSARGILVVIGGVALLATGMWFWLRDDGADEDEAPSPEPEPDDDEDYADL
jgi:hypothetical protein